MFFSSYIFQPKGNLAEAIVQPRIPRRGINLNLAWEMLGWGDTYVLLSSDYRESPFPKWGLPSDWPFHFLRPVTSRMNRPVSSFQGPVKGTKVFSSQMSIVTIILGGLVFGVGVTHTCSCQVITESPSKRGDPSDWPFRDDSWVMCDTSWLTTGELRSWARSKV